MTLYAQWRHPYIPLNSSSGNFELLDGNVLSGTGGMDTHITIADGATVTLYNVNITRIVDLTDHSWAGITCLGDATIIVKGTNAVKGGWNSAGIFVPSGKTLTITGDGSLTATGNNNGCAGIGGNKETNCGNIVIDGGTITAVGYLYAAGIGGGYNASCGDITITGGGPESVPRLICNSDKSLSVKDFSAPSAPSPSLPN